MPFHPRIDRRGYSSAVTVSGNGLLENPLKRDQERGADREQDGGGQNEENERDEHLQGRLGPRLAHLVSSPQPYLARKDGQR